MRGCTESVALDTDLIARAYATADKCKVNGCSSGGKAYDLAVERLAAVSLAVGKCLKVFLKGIYIRSHRDNPVGVKGFFDIFLFPALFAHMS